MEKKPIDQLIYEARCKALGIEPAPFGEISFDKINEERREKREETAEYNGALSTRGGKSGA